MVNHHSLKDTQARRQVAELREAYYRSGVWDQTTWLGRKVLKPVQDLWLYQEVIWRESPRAILETGTRFGGSAWFFASVLELAGLSDSLVISVDLDGPTLQHHPNIRYLTGNSVAQATVDQVKELAPDGIDLLSLDSDHTKAHVLKELAAYAPLVVPGGLLVVEDTWAMGPGEDALGEWDDPSFEVDPDLQDKFLMSFARWYRKVG